MPLEDHHIVTLRLLLEAMENIPRLARLAALRSDLKTKVQLCRDGMVIYRCMFTDHTPDAAALRPVLYNATCEEYKIGLAMHAPLLELAMNAASIEELEARVKNHPFKRKPVPTDPDERSRGLYAVSVRHCARRRLQRLGAAIGKT